MGTHKNCAKSGGKWITDIRRLAIHLRDGFLCVYCLKDLHGAQPGERQLDHVIAQSSGKKDHSCRNLVTCCRNCNSKRRNKLVREFATREAVIRIKNWTRRSMPRYIASAKELLANETSSLGTTRTAGAA